MSTTEKLRALLDERGVEHEDKYTELAPGSGGWDSTWWQGVAGMTFMAISDETFGRENCVYINETYLTPEQAITATLGNYKCTCHNDKLNLAERLQDIATRMRTCAMCNHVQEIEAIADTLGGGTCERTTTRNGKFKTKYGRKVPLCECCGYAIGDDRYNFCPKCGAKIVEAVKR